MTGFLAALRRAWVVAVIAVGLLLGYCLDGPEGLPPDSMEDSNGHGSDSTDPRTGA